MLGKLKRGLLHAMATLRGLLRGRSRKPSATPPIQVYLSYADWDGLILFNAALDKNSNAFGQLTSAVAQLSRCIEMFENQAGTRKEYNKLAIDMNELFKVLSEYFVGAAPSRIMQDRILRLAMDINKETEPFLAEDEGNLAGRDIDQVLGCYLRVRASLGRFALNENPKMWKVTGEEAPDSQLARLSHSPTTQYRTPEPSVDNRTGCGPNTRVAVLQELRDWAHYSDSPRIYWLNGTAGTGKTTIAYSFCEQLESAGKLAASFFCSRQRPESRDANRILPSVAYQLAELSRPFRSAISSVLEQNPEVHKLSIPRQLRSLVTTPLRKVKYTFPGDMVIVIDAIDECEDSVGVDQILDSLHLHAFDLPVKFFITSRPTSEILDNMESERDERVKSRLCLDELDRLIVQKDITAYLTAKLGHLRPSTTDLEVLVQLSGTHFAHAVTLASCISQVNFVDDADGMRRILDAATTEGIDKLYSTTLGLILGGNDLESTRRDDMILLLHTVVCAHDPLSLNAITSLPGLSSVDSTHTMLRSLRSVLQISEASGLVTTVHSSFSEYMLNRERSGEFHCDARHHNARLAQACFDLVKENLPQFNICNLESSYQRDQDVQDMDRRVNEAISPGLLYACLHLGSYLELAGYSEELLDAVYDFLSRRLLLWMEILNLRRCIREGDGQLHKLQFWLEGVECSSAVRHLAEDGQRFVAAFSSNSMSECTPHIYISMLPLWPEDSPIATHYMPRMSGFVNATGTRKREYPVSGRVLSYDNEARCATFSPDSAYIACGSEDNTIRTWDVNTGKLVGQTFKGHTRPVMSIAYSPDGAYIVSGSGDSTVRIWDTRTGELVGRPLWGHTDWVYSVVYSPDGAYIVSGGDDKTIRIWDTQTQQPVGQPLVGHTGWVGSVAYSPDGAFIASGSSDKTIRIWDAHTRQLVGQPLEGHTDAVRSLAYSPNGARIVSGSWDRTVRIWDAHTGQPVNQPLEYHDLSITSVAYSPDGAYIASGSTDNTIWIWDAHTWPLVAQPLGGHTDQIWSIAYSPDGAYIISSSKDKTIRIWDTRIRQPVGQPLEGHERLVRSVAYSPDGAYFVSGSMDRTIRIWHASTGELVGQPLEGHAGGVLSIVYSHDGAYIVSGSWDMTIRIWDARTQQLVGQPIEGHTGHVWSVAYSPDGAYIVSGSSDKTIRIWDARTRELVGQPLEGHTDSVISVAYSPNGAYIASCSQDNTVRIWDALTGQLTGQPLEGHTGHVWSVVYSPDGAYIASASRDKIIRIWNAPTQKPVGRPLEGHTAGVRSIAYSPDGAYILSGSFDSTIRIWNAHTGEQVGQSLEGHTGSVYSVAYSPDGGSILSGSGHVIRTYVAHPAQVTLPETATSQSGPPTSHPPDSVIPLSRAEHDALTSPATPTDDASDHTSNPKAAKTADDWTMDQDGWVLSANRDRLLWVPHHLRRGLVHPRNKVVISRGGTLRLDFKDAKLGEDWRSCFN